MTGEQRALELARPRDLAQTFVFTVKPISLNHAFPDNANRPGRHKSVEYAQWASQAGWQLRIQRPKPVPSKYFGAMLAIGRGLTKADLDNLPKVQFDLLTSLGIIKSDRYLVDMRVLAVPGQHVYIKIWPEPEPTIPLDELGLDFNLINGALRVLAPRS